MSTFVRTRAALAIGLVLIMLAVVLAPATPADAGGTHALMVVGNVNSGKPPSKDRPVLALLQSLGFDVELVNDDDATAGDADGKEVVIVSSSVVPSKIGDLFASIAIPVVTWEGYLFDDFGFTEGAHGGTSTTQTALEIVDDTHPISAGYSGDVEVSTESHRFAYAAPVPSAQVVATAGSRSVIFAFEADAALATGPAPARRVALFMNYQAAGSLTQAGSDIVAAAVGWATETTGVPGNTAPSVEAGPNQTIQAVAAVDVDLDATVSDDGRPVPPGSLTSTWTGPDGAVFADASSVDTTVTLPGPGEYLLTLEVSDGELTTSDTVTIVVSVPENMPPVVDAGLDQSIVLPLSSVDLDGTISDDGVPLPPDLQSTWSQFSGPAGVIFGDASAVDTTATFPGAGQYVLQLTANDGELATSDNVTINVDAEAPTDITIAYIASKTSLPSGDRPIRDRFEANGATVTPIDDDALLDDYSEFDLIFLSTSVVLTKVNDHLADVAVPVITNEQHLYDDMNMATSPIGVRNSATVKIAAPGDELAASKTGTVTVTTAATNLGYGSPGPDASIIATVNGTAVYFAYRTGDEMANGESAPARRVAFPGTFPTARVANANYFALLDAAVAFAITPDSRNTSADDTYQTTQDLGFFAAEQDLLFALEGDFGMVVGAVALDDGRVVILGTAGMFVCSTIPNVFCVDAVAQAPLFEFLVGGSVLNDGRIAILPLFSEVFLICTVEGSCEQRMFDREILPFDILNLPTGQLVVTDIGDPEGGGGGSVHRCDGDATGCEPILTSQTFANPAGIDMLSDGRVVIADLFANAVFVCDIVSDVCESFGSAGVGAGQFDQPAGLSVTADDRIVVADLENTRLQVCTLILDGAICEILGDDLFYPFVDVTVSADGRIVGIGFDATLAAVFYPPGVLANDGDVGAAGVVRSDSVSAHGASVDMDSEGGFFYDPTTSAAIALLAPGEILNDTFTYDFVTSAGVTQTAVVTVIVSGISKTPLAQADELVGNADGLAPAGAVLQNDSDPTARPLTITAVTFEDAAGVVSSVPLSGVPSIVTTLGGRELSVDFETGPLAAGDSTPHLTTEYISDFTDLAEGDTDSVVLTYTITNDLGLSDTSTITVTIVGAAGG